MKPGFPDTPLKKFKKKGFKDFESAQINIVTLTMEHMAACNVKGDAYSVEPAANYQPIVRLSLALLDASASFSTSSLHLQPSVFVPGSHEPRLQQQQAAVFGKTSSDKPSVDYLADRQCYRLMGRYFIKELV